MERTEVKVHISSKELESAYKSQNAYFKRKSVSLIFYFSELPVN